MSHLSPLYSTEALHRRVSELAEQLRRDYAGKTPLFLGVLTGSFIFLSDLVRALDLPCQVDFLAVRSYGQKTESSGAPRLVFDTKSPILGRDVILVEDILDSGHTLRYIMDLIRGEKPASVSSCVLLDKPSRRQVPFVADYVGFAIPDVFVVGYGLDYAGDYRALPYVGVLEP